MAIKMVREPSDTPNITNIDDIIPFRYAYGNQNGFVLGRGTEISNTISGLNFTINSGRLVLQGVECDIDASGVTVTIDNIATKRYYTVYLQVNLATNTATVLATYDTANYPNPPASDDLTENSTGTAYLLLYHFTAQSGVISEVEKIVQGIQYINPALNDYDISKGTIESRLTNLGFKQGSIQLSSYVSTPSINVGTVTKNIVKRQGNYVLGEFEISFLLVTGDTGIGIGTIPENFRPKNTIYVGVRGAVSGNSLGENLPRIAIFPSGLVEVERNGDELNYDFSIIAFNFGYEAEPIE